MSLLHPYTKAGEGITSATIAFDSLHETFPSVANKELASRLASFVASYVGCEPEDCRFHIQVAETCKTYANGTLSEHVSSETVAVSFAFHQEDHVTSNVCGLTEFTVCPTRLGLLVKDKVFSSALENIGKAFLSIIFEVNSVVSNRSLINFPLPQIRRRTWSRLPDEFIRQATQCPNKTAVQFLNDDNSLTCLTYADALIQARLLSRALLDSIPITKRTQKDVIVPMLLHPSPELYVAYLGILISGFAFCPLPLDAPEARIKSMLHQIDATVLVGSGPVPKMLQKSGIQFIDIASTVQEEREGPKECVSVPHAQDCAYLLFTSGTTGQPKGVMVSHRSIVVSIQAHIDHLLKSPSPPTLPFKWFQFASSVFDPSIMEIFVTLSLGSTLCSATRDRTLSDLNSVIHLSQANIMMCTPSVATLLDPKRVPKLETLWTMGEALNPTVVRRFSAEHRRLGNAYGPTEGTINCTLLSPFPSEFRGSIIGSPLPSCSLAIVDAQLRPVVKGMCGELVILGPQVAMGYLDLESSAFVSLKLLSDQPMLPAYRTADQARIVWDSKGVEHVEVLGRMNAEQVKLNGRRVELSEIDSILSTSAALQHVASVVLRGRLIASLVPKSSSYDANLLEQECRQICHRMLQPHMHPTEYVVMQSLPVNASGKLDRRRLLQQVELSSQTSKYPQCSGLHEHVPQSMQLILDAVRCVCPSADQHIYPGANLFRLGLDSLTAMRLVNHLRKLETDLLSIPTSFSVASLLTCADVQALHDFLTRGPITDTNEAKEKEGKWAEELSNFRARTLPSIKVGVKASLEAVYPTTSTQSGMLTSFLRHHSYINHTVYHFDTAQQAESWHSTLLNNLLSHDAFRTIFVAIDDPLAPFAQCVLRADQIDLRSNTSIDEDGEHQEAALTHYLDRVEKQIKLDRPPWQLGRVGNSVVLSMHHAIFDGGSLELVERLVPSSNANGIAVAVADHFMAALDDSREFWSMQTSLIAATSFPAIHGRHVEIQSVSTECSVVEELVDMSFAFLDSKAQSLESTSAILLQTVWNMVLAAYSESEDQYSMHVVSGSVLSGRLSEELQTCVAPTFNTIPFILSLSDCKTFRDALRNATSRWPEAVKHTHTPLGTWSKGLLFDTLFAVQRFQADEMPSSIVGSRSYPRMRNDFSAMVEVWPQDRQMRLRITYAERVMDRRSAHIVVRQFADMLRLVLDQPEISIAALIGGVGLDQSLLSHTPIGAKSNVEHVSGPLLHSQFEKMAKVYPERAALEFYSDSDSDQAEACLSYADLERQAQGLCWQIVAQGNSARRIIPICMERSVNLYIGILAILKSGAAWCPIDVDAPLERKRHLIQRTKSDFVLVSASTQEQLRPLEKDVKLLNVDMMNFDYVCSATVKGVETQTNDMAYLIWTSGTTGAPKGVMITHAAAVHSMSSLHSEIHPPSERPVRCLQLSAYTFDVFVQDLFWTWSHGGTVIGSTKMRMLTSTAELVRQAHCDHAHLTPALAAQMSACDLAGLRSVTFIGEKLTRSVAREWNTAGRTVYNTYGPAEVTIVSTTRKLEPEESVVCANVGHPLKTVGVMVSKPDQLTPCPIGTIGELLLSGPQLALGYLDDNERTAKAFQDQWYRTGDFARMLADRSVEFIGRRDDLVKLGGIRVELSEISAAFAKEAVTMLLSRPDRPTSQLVTFLNVMHSAEKVAEAELVRSDDTREAVQAEFERIKSILPAYMLPSLILTISKVPKTASGKIDRSKLQLLYESANFDEELIKSTEQNEGQKDTTEMTKFLRDIIHELTGTPREKIRLNTPLSSIGLDSIRMIRLATKIKSKVGTASMASIIVCQTLDMLEDCLNSDREKAQIDERTTKINKILTQSSLKVDTYPCSLMQEGMLAETLVDPMAYWSVHYIGPIGVKSIASIQARWMKMAACIGTLRVCIEVQDEMPFRFDGGRPSFALQHILSSPVDRVDPRIRSHASDATHSQAVFEWLKEVADECRDLDVPLWKVGFFKTSQDVIMVLCIHHALYDGPSIDVLLDLARSTRPLSQSMFTSVREQCVRSYLYTAEEQKAANDYWFTLLRPRGPAVRFPDMTQNLPRKDEKRKFVLENLVVSIKSPQEVKTAFAATLAQYVEIEDPQQGVHVLLGEILSERHRADCLAAPLALGPLIVTLPFSLLAKPTDSLAELMEQTRSQSYPHRFASLSSLAKDANISSSSSTSSSIFTAMFVYHPYVAEVSKDQDDFPLRLDSSVQVEHSVVLNVFEQRDQSTMRLELCIKDDLASREVVRMTLEQVRLVLESSTNPMPIRKILSMHPEQHARHQQSTAAEYKGSEPLRWLEHYARHRPAWPAVVIGDDDLQTTSYTYAELDNQSNRLANYVSSVSGWQSDLPIALCMRRSWMSIVGLVTIFKLGRTYLPIDEDLPIQRKRLLIKDSHAGLVFTESDCLAEVETSCPTVQLDNVSLDSYPCERQQERLEGSRAAYLLYTSGSTGHPKGVLVSRRSLASFVESYASILVQHAPATTNLGGTGRYLGLASRAFDVHLSQTFMAWRFGFALTTADRTVLLADLSSASAQLGITHLSCVPSLLDTLPSSVVMLGVGGEKLTEHVRDRFASQVPVLNAYGPTETTIMCTVSPVSSDSLTRNIGRVLPGNSATIIDPLQSTIVPLVRGQPGELFIEGPLVAIGYNGEVAKSGFAHGGYRTGDIARMMPDGTIHFLGRRDDQQKISGQRLELGEITQTVQSQTSGSVTTTIVKRKEASKPLLVTLIAPSNQKSSNVPELLKGKRESDLIEQCKQHCSKTLPAYMVPDCFLVVSHLTTLSTSGKQDAKEMRNWLSSLPLPTLFGQESGSSIEKPLTEMEDRVIRAIGKIVDLTGLNVQADMSIYQLGLDSLSVIRLAKTLKRQGVKVASVARLRTHPRICDIAQQSEDDQEGLLDLDLGQQIVDQFGSKYDVAMRETHGNNLASVLPCLPVQEGMVALSLVSQEEIYVARIEMDDPIASMQSLIDQHSILRTCFEHVASDTIAQIVLRSVQADQHHVDAAADSQSVFQSILQEIGTRPPWRISSDAKTLWIHHALYDGHSLPLLLSNDSSSLGVLPLLTYTYAVDPERARAFWRATFSHVNPTRADTIACKKQRRELRISLSPIDKLARELKVTLASLLSVLVHLSLDDGSNVLGVVLSGRSIELQRADKIVGPCITTVPMPLPRREGTVALWELVQEAHAWLSRALAFQHSSLRDIRRWIQWPRHSIIDALFSFSQVREEIGGERRIEAENDARAAVQALANYPEDLLTFSVALKYETDIDRLLDRIRVLSQSGPQAMVTIRTADCEPKVAEQQEFREAESETQRMIKSIVVELTGLDSNAVGIDTPFLQLGIDSIMVLRLTMRLKQIGIVRSPFEILQSGTIAFLAQSSSTSVDERAETRQSNYQCTPLQSGMLNHSQVAQDTSLYIHHHTMRLDADIDLDCLDEAICNVILTHDILRTQFNLDDGTWMAKVRKSSLTRFERVATQQTATTYIQENMPKVRISPKEPWKALVIQTPQEQCMVLSMHHSLYDGISLRLLLNDLAAAYRGERLPSRPSFAGKAEQIRATQYTAVNFWTSTLSNLMSSSLLQLGGSEYHVSVTKISDQLSNLQSLGVSLQSICMLAWAKVLSTYLGHRDVCFGQVVLGRFTDVDTVPGPTINTVAFRVNLENLLLTNLEATRRIHSRVMDGQPHQHASLKEVQNKFGGPLFNSLFVFHSDGNHSAQSGWQHFEVEEQVSSSGTEYPVNISIVHATDGLHVRAGVMGSAGWLEDLLRLLRNTILDILNAPQRSVGSYPYQLASLPLQQILREDRPPTGRRFLDAAEKRKLEKHASKRLNRPVTSSCNLYSLGLDSLLSIGITLKCRKDGVQITPQDLLAARCIDKVTISLVQGTIKAARLLDPKEEDEALERLSVHRKDVQAILPVLKGQKQHIDLWLQRQRRFLEPTFVYRSEAILEHDRLQSAWNLLRQRHEILRTMFARTSNDRLVQVILKPDSDVWQKTSRVLRSSCAEEHLQNLNRTPSDLYRPPVRLSLVEKCLVFITIHHSCYDAWSMRLLATELYHLYSEPPSTDLPVSFVDYVRHTADAETEGMSSQDEAARGESTLLCNADGSVEQTLVRFDECHLPDCRAPLFIIAFARLLSNQIGAQKPTFGFYTTGRDSDYDRIVDLVAPTMSMQAIVVDLVTETIHRDVSPCADFDSHLNLLFVDEDDVSQSRNRWKPHRIQIDSGYYTSQPRMAGSTSVSNDKIEEREKAQLFLDVAIDRKRSTMRVTARCDASAMDVTRVTGLCKEFAALSGARR